MSYEITGTVKLVNDKQVFASGFEKREFVIVTDADQYPQEIKFETVKDKTSILDSISEGDRVNVHFDVRGNEFKDRYYVNLTAWKIDSSEKSEAQQQPTASEASEDHGDLPF